MAMLLITHDLGVVAEMCRARLGDVCRAGGGGSAGGRAVRQAARTPTRAACCARSRGRAGARRRRLPEIPGVVPGLLARRSRGCAFAPALLARASMPVAQRAAAVAVPSRPRPSRRLRSVRRRPHDRRPVLEVAGPDQALRHRARLLRRNGGELRAVDGVSLADPARAKRWASWARCGCGKSTLGQLVMRLLRAVGGRDPDRGARRQRRCPPTRCGRAAGACRWCSRIRTRR